MIPSVDRNYLLDSPRPDGNWAYVYGLFDPAEQVIRYVGRTNTPRIRLCGHQTKGAKDARYPVKRWIADLHASGRRPCMIILEVCDSSVAGVKEYEWYHRAATVGDMLNTRPVVTPGNGKLHPNVSSSYADMINYPQFAIITVTPTGGEGNYYDIFRHDDSKMQKYAKVIKTAQELSEQVVVEVTLTLPDAAYLAGLDASTTRAVRLLVAWHREQEKGGE